MPMRQSPRNQGKIQNRQPNQNSGAQCFCTASERPAFAVGKEDFLIADDLRDAQLAAFDLVGREMCVQQDQFPIGGNTTTTKITMDPK